MQKLFENWRSYLEEQDEEQMSRSDEPVSQEPEPSQEPGPGMTMAPREQTVDETSIKDVIEYLADEKLKSIKASPKKGFAKIVPCYGGDCIDQMIANEHAPLWSYYSLRQIIRKKYPRLLKKLRSAITIDKVGKFGAYKQGFTRPMMGSVRARNGDPKYIVIHSSTTNNPMRTVAALQARAPKPGLASLEEARGHEHGGFSTNYEVYYDGTIYEYFPPEMVTTHAGGHNNYSIGIDLTGKPNQHTSTQISALQDLIEELVSRYKIPYNVAPFNMVFKNDRELIRSAYGVVAHRSVAGAGRRGDPGSNVMTALGASEETAIAMAATRAAQKLQTEKQQKRRAELNWLESALKGELQEKLRELQVKEKELQGYKI